MRAYRVELRPAASRALKKIKDRVVLRRIAHAIEGLEHAPRPAGATAVQGGDGVLRIRVGDYRILYTIDDDVLLVLVITLGHRREVYR